MTDQKPTPARLNRLIQRDLSASPDSHHIERCAERWVSDEDKGILEAWKPALCVKVRVG